MARRVEIKAQSASSYYTFPINPIEFENLDNDELNVQRTVDGYSFEFKPIFDGRPRRMHWENIPNKEPYITLVATLKALKGTACNLRLNYLTGSTTDTTVQNIRIIDCATTWKQGGFNDQGFIKFATIDLLYVPIP